MGSLLTLAGKDLKLLFRDKFGLFWIFAFPLMYAAFFGMIFGGAEDDNARGSLSIAIVDEDDTEGSRSLAEELSRHESIRVARRENGDIVMQSLEEARNEVRRGRRVAYLRIPEGYGDEPFAIFAGGDDQPRMELGIDPSRGAERGFLQGILMQTVFTSMSDRFTDKELIKDQLQRGKDEVKSDDGLSTGQKIILQSFMDAVGSFIDEIDMEVLEQGPGGLADQELFEVVDVTREVGQRPRSAFEVSFPQAMVWGLMGVALAFAITLVRERTQGTLLRLRMAPIGRAQLLGGKSLACFAACMMTMSFLLAFGMIVLGVRVSDPLLLLLAILSTAVCFTGIMMTASVMGKTEQAVAGAAWGSMMPFAMIGGGMIPLVAMPSWLVTASDYSPFKWAIYSLEGAIWRGFTLTDMLGPCAILLAIGAGFFALGLWVYRKTEA